MFWTGILFIFANNWLFCARAAAARNVIWRQSNKNKRSGPNALPSQPFIKPEIAAAYDVIDQYTAVTWKRANVNRILITDNNTEWRQMLSGDKSTQVGLL